MATPAEPRGEKNIFCENFGRRKTFFNLLRSAGEIFLSGLRGANTFSVAFRIVFRIFFSRFSNRFSYRFQNFSGAISFCRHGALRRGIARNFRSGDHFLRPLKWQIFKLPFRSNSRSHGNRASLASEKCT